MKRESSAKQFLKDARYWVEVEHKDICATCKQGMGDQCALAPVDATKHRTRVAQFIYFLEALDYVAECNKRGVSVWLRKPLFKLDKVESEYTFYDYAARKQPAGTSPGPGCPIHNETSIDCDYCMAIKENSAVNPTNASQR